MYLTKKALFDHLEKEVYCRLGASPVHGLGVFAFRAIPSGINPFKSWLDIDEIKFSREELKVLPPNSRDLLDTFCYHNEDTVCVPVVGLNVVNISIYINHSKKPNLIMNKDGSFTTMRKITTGEELLMDYDISFEEEHSF
jgi:SET domain-containing protein